MLVKTGQGQAHYVPEPRIKIGSAYQAPVRRVPEDQAWVQDAMLGEGVWFKRSVWEYLMGVLYG